MEIVKHVPHCPSCNSRKVKEISKWTWITIWVITSIALCIFLIGIVTLILTPFLLFIPTFWECRNCKRWTKEKNMVFRDVSIDH